jgi:SAM-dependent methyltransferase
MPPEEKFPEREKFAAAKNDNLENSPSHVVKKVQNTRWKEAQNFELKYSQLTIGQDDDWNRWWRERFNDYSIIKGKHFSNVLEVGCGAHTNIRYILPEITCNKIWLEDPLIQYYLTHDLKECGSLLNYLKTKIGRRKTNYLIRLFSDLTVNVDISSSKLENLPYKDSQMDLIICINVLDHVTDYDLCMNEIFRVLKNEGVLILGQDLSGHEDFQECPESYTDIGHPIKVDENSIEQTINDKYKKLFESILSRNEGRNPKAHYGTYLGILQKC